MSTSMLVSKMQEAAKNKSIDATIWAVGDAQSKSEVGKADIVCLGPQVRYLENKMKDRVEHKIPVMVIDISAYGQMNGEKVLQDAIDAIHSFKE